MSGRSIPLALLAVVAAAGPLVVGSSDAPAVAPSAAQLLPPLTVVAELPLEGGGIVRARQIRIAKSQVSVRLPDGWRSLDTVRPAGPLRARTLWLGSDHQGRDVLARAVHGARTSLAIAALAMAVALGLGTAVGLGAALGPSFSARAALRIATDGALAIPRLLLVLILAVGLRGSLAGTAFAIGIVSWMDVARLVEARARALRSLPFAASVRVQGAGPLRLALRHILPNLSPVLSATAPLVAAEAVLLESTLSFLGAGAGSVSWGAMVADSQRFLPASWWMAVFPGLLLCATALSFRGIGSAGQPQYRRRKETGPRADRTRGPEPKVDR